MNRVYIYKSDGKRLRPLGVPQFPDRIILTLFTKIIEAMLINNSSPRQHLFVPGRGLHTLWAEILRNVDKMDNIYQYDLKGFFNSINLPWLHDNLEEMGIKGWALDWIRRANHSLFQSYKSPEPVDIQSDVDMAPWSTASQGSRTSKNIVVSLDDILQEAEDIDKWNHPQVINKPVIKKKKLVNRYIKSSEEYPSKRGVPQGLAWSPLLSTIILPKSGLFDIPGIAAADDGLWWWTGNSIDKPEEGIKQNPEFQKSQIEFSDKQGSCEYVKKDGQWLQELHFAGSTYNPTKRTLNNVPIEKIMKTPELLTKIVGKTVLSSYDLTEEDSPRKLVIERYMREGKISKLTGYLTQSQLEDYRLTTRLETDQESWITTIKDAMKFGKPENYDKSPYWTMKLNYKNSGFAEGYTLWYSVLTDKSAICLEQLAEILRFRNKESSKSFPRKEVKAVEFSPLTARVSTETPEGPLLDDLKSSNLRKFSVTGLGRNWMEEVKRQGSIFLKSFLATITFLLLILDFPESMMEQPFIEEEDTTVSSQPPGNERSIRSKLLYLSPIILLILSMSWLLTQTILQETPDLSVISNRLLEIEAYNRNAILVASGVDDPRLR
jgi:hypothetical protein